jgi:hypothetical protein
LAGFHHHLGGETETKRERERGREVTTVFFLGHKKHLVGNSSLFASHVESIKIHYLYFIFQNAPCTNFFLNLIPPCDTQWVLAG